MRFILVACLFLAGCGEADTSIDVGVLDAGDEVQGAETTQDAGSDVVTASEQKDAG